METETLAAPEEINDISDVKRKMRFTGTVVKTTLAGAIVDIGLDTPGVVHISQLKKDSVNRVEDVVEPGQNVEVWIRHVDPKKNRIELTMVEPLAMEWRDMNKGMVVKGTVVRLEKFGAFVEIGAERPGLVHISEMTHDYIHSPNEVVKVGDEIEVKILGVNRRKKQIRLSMKALEEKPAKVAQSVQKAASEPSEKNEPVPTAMELALREAMERAKTREEEEVTQSKPKSPPKNAEMEDILKRTLKHKVKTGSN